MLILEIYFRIYSSYLKLSKLTKFLFALQTDPQCSDMNASSVTSPDGQSSGRQASDTAFTPPSTDESPPPTTTTDGLPSSAVLPQPSSTSSPELPPATCSDEASSNATSSNQQNDEPTSSTEHSISTLDNSLVEPPSITNVAAFQEKSSISPAAASTTPNSSVLSNITNNESNNDVIPTIPTVAAATAKPLPGGVLLSATAIPPTPTLESCQTNCVGNSYSNLIASEINNKTYANTAVTANDNVKCDSSELGDKNKFNPINAAASSSSSSPSSSQTITGTICKSSTDDNVATSSSISNDDSKTVIDCAEHKEKSLPDVHKNEKRSWENQFIHKYATTTTEIHKADERKMEVISEPPTTSDEAANIEIDGGASGCESTNIMELSRPNGNGSTVACDNNVNLFSDGSSRTNVAVPSDSNRQEISDSIAPSISKNVEATIPPICTRETTTESHQTSSNTVASSTQSTIDDSNNISNNSSTPNSLRYPETSDKSHEPVVISHIIISDTLKNHVSDDRLCSNSSSNTSIISKTNGDSNNKHSSHADQSVIQTSPFVVAAKIRRMSRDITAAAATTSTNNNSQDSVDLSSASTTAKTPPSATISSKNNNRDADIIDSYSSSHKRMKIGNDEYSYQRLAAHSTADSSLPLSSTATGSSKPPNSNMYQQPGQIPSQSSPPQPIPPRNNSLYVSNPDFTKSVPPRDGATRDLSPLRMKPPDFSRLYAGGNEQNSINDFYRNKNKHQQHPPAPPPPSAVNANNFAEIRKRYKFISDLQLKNPGPTQPSASVPPPLLKSAIVQSTTSDSTTSSSSTSKSFNNLYVKPPDFTKSSTESSSSVPSSSSPYVPQELMSADEPTAHIIHKSQFLPQKQAPTESIRQAKQEPSIATSPVVYRNFPQISQDVTMSIVAPGNQHYHQQQPLIPPSSTPQQVQQSDKRSFQYQQSMKQHYPQQPYQAHGDKHQTPAVPPSHHMQYSVPSHLNKDDLRSHEVYHPYGSENFYGNRVPDPYPPQTQDVEKDLKRYQGHQPAPLPPRLVPGAGSTTSRAELNSSNSNRQDLNKTSGGSRGSSSNSSPVNHRPENYVKQNSSYVPRNENPGTYYETATSKPMHPYPPSVPPPPLRSGIEPPSSRSHYDDSYYHNQYVAGTPASAMHEVAHRSRSATTVGAANMVQRMRSPVVQHAPPQHQPPAGHTDNFSGQMNPPQNWPGQNPRVTQSPISLSSSPKISQSPIGASPSPHPHGLPPPQSPTFLYTSPQATPCPSPFSAAASPIPLKHSSSPSQFYQHHQQQSAPAPTNRDVHYYHPNRHPEPQTQQSSYPYQPPVTSKPESKERDAYYTPSGQTSPPPDQKRVVDYVDLTKTPKPAEFLPSAPAKPSHTERYQTTQSAILPQPASTIIKHAASEAIKTEKQNYGRQKTIMDPYVYRQTSEADLNYQIIKKTLNKDISIRRSDTDLSRSIFDNPKQAKENSGQEAYYPMARSNSDRVYPSASTSSGYPLEPRVESKGVIKREDESRYYPQPIAKETVYTDGSQRRSSLPYDGYARPTTEISKHDLSVTVSRISANLSKPTDRVRPSISNVAAPPTASSSLASTHQSREPSAYPVTQNYSQAMPLKLKTESSSPIHHQSATTTILPSGKPSSVFAPIKRESPLDLSVKTVKTKADSTGCDYYSRPSSSRHRTANATVGHNQLKVDFAPNFQKHSAVAAQPGASRVEYKTPANYPTNGPPLSHGPAEAPNSSRHPSAVVIPVLHPQQKQQLQQQQHQHQQLLQQYNNQAPGSASHQRFDPKAYDQNYDRRTDQRYPQKPITSNIHPTTPASAIAPTAPTAATQPSKSRQPLEYSRNSRPASFEKIPDAHRSAGTTNPLVLNPSVPTVFGRKPEDLKNLPIADTIPETASNSTRGNPLESTATRFGRNKEIQMQYLKSHPVELNQVNKPKIEAIGTYEQYPATISRHPAEMNYQHYSAIVRPTDATEDRFDFSKNEQSLHPSDVQKIQHQPYDTEVEKRRQEHYGHATGVMHPPLSGQYYGMTKGYKADDQKTPPSSHPPQPPLLHSQHPPSTGGHIKSSADIENFTRKRLAESVSDHPSKRSRKEPLPKQPTSSQYPSNNAYFRPPEHKYNYASLPHEPQSPPNIQTTSQKAKSAHSSMSNQHSQSPPSRDYSAERLLYQPHLSGEYKQQVSADLQNPYHHLSRKEVYQNRAHPPPSQPPAAHTDRDIRPYPTHHPDTRGYPSSQPHTGNHIDTHQGAHRYQGPTQTHPAASPTQQGADPYSPVLSHPGPPSHFVAQSEPRPQPHPGSHSNPRHQSHSGLQTHHSTQPQPGIQPHPAVQHHSGSQSYHTGSQLHPSAQQQSQPHEHPDSKPFSHDRYNVDSFRSYKTDGPSDGYARHPSHYTYQSQHPSQYPQEQPIKQGHAPQTQHQWYPQPQTIDHMQQRPQYYRPPQPIYTRNDTSLEYARASAPSTITSQPHPCEDPTKFGSYRMSQIANDQTHQPKAAPPPPSTVQPDAPPQLNPYQPTASPAQPIRPHNGIKGVDQTVISKLRTNLEMKEIEKQKLLRNQVSLELQDDDSSSRSDLAQQMSKAKFRTKGEVKSFQPIAIAEQTKTVAPPTVCNEENDDHIADPLIVPTVIRPQFEAMSTDLDSSSALDLMDWGSACNDFVEQLQSGGGKKRGVGRRRKRGTSTATDPRLETVEPEMPLEQLHNKCDNEENVVDIVKSENTNLPKEVATIIKTEQIIKVAAVKASTSSSDENTPLVILRQQSRNENLKQKKDDAVDLDKQKEVSTSVEAPNSSIKSERTVILEKLSEKIAKNKKEQQREKREHEKKLTITTSSDSEAEAAAGRIKQRPKKIIRKPRTRAGTGIKNSSSGDDSSNDDNDERARKRRGLELLKKNGLSEIGTKKRHNDVKSSSDSEPLSMRRKVMKLESDAKSEVSDDEDGPIVKLKALQQKPEAEKSSATSDSSSDSDGKHKASSKKSGAGKTAVQIKIEETMTRSKRKRELEQQLASSKVLRNDKVVKNVMAASNTGTSEKTKGGGSDAGSTTTKKTNEKTPQKLGGLKGGRSNSLVKIDVDEDDQKTIKKRSLTRISSSKSQIQSDNSDDSEDTDKVLAIRLRTRASKSMNESTDQKTPDKTTTRSTAASETKKNTKATPKKAAAKDSPTKIVVAEKPEAFPVGWEEKLYEYKVSLKVPARLITVGKPPWHRKSTSLPDLDPQHSSDTSETFSEQMKKKLNFGATESPTKREATPPVPKRGRPSNAMKAANSIIIEPPKSPAIEKPVVVNELKFMSIIDRLHQRVIRPVAGKMSKKLRNVSSEPKILPQSTEVELLPTPGEDGPNVFKHQNVFETAVLQSRTRKEHRVQKKQEIIRGVFGCDNDRPASAPPLNCDDIKTENGVKVLLPPSSTSALTYDQKYQQYLEKMDVKFDTSDRKSKQQIVPPRSENTTPSTTTSTSPESILLHTIKQEKMDEDSLPNAEDDETQDTELIECTATIKEELADVIERTPSVLSEREGQTPNSFKSYFPAKKNRGNRAGRRKGSSG